MINMPEKQPPKLLDQVRDRIRVKHVKPKHSLYG